jgi:uncharacterized protein (TIGR04255 family)
MSSLQPFHLSKNPIALVLCQVRFSRIMGMESSYLPDIQARLRGIGFKVNASREIAQVVMTPQGPQTQATKVYEFQNLGRTESVVVAPDFVTYQATRYVRFQDFLDRFLPVLDQISTVTNGLTVERIGLRYVDVVIPKANESWQHYVQPGLRGIAPSGFKAGEGEQVHQIVAETVAGGTMIIRVLSNSKGIPLPHDVATSKLSLNIQGEIVPNMAIAVVDIDHFCCMEPNDYNTAYITERLWELKRVILDVWKDKIVTKEALEAWA